MLRIRSLVLRFAAVAAVASVLAGFAGNSAKRVVGSGVSARSSLSWISAYGAEAVMIDKAARDFKLPEQITWTGREGSGIQTATLFGDPSKSGLYIQLLKRGPNNWSRPHSHEGDRFITVLAGTMWIGTGTKFDPENTQPLRPGSFVRDIAKQVHFDGSKEDGLTIEIVGMGPEKTIPATETK
jgi:hypothetical protein